MKKLKHKAFSLLELLVVISVIAIIVSIAIPNIVDVTKKKHTRYYANPMGAPVPVETNTPQRFCPYCGHSLP